MNYAELLGFSPVFGMQDEVPGMEKKPGEEKPKERKAQAPNDVNLTDQQLLALSRMNAMQTQAGGMRPPGAMAPHYAPAPQMTQIQLPQVQPIVRPGLGQLIYGR